MKEEFHALHLLERIKHMIDEMKPLPQRKVPGLAFLAGAVLGAVGVGLYLRSLKDCAVCFGMALVVMIILAPTVVGEIAALPLGSILAAIYGGYRATSSNRKLDASGKTSPPLLPKKAA
jgi:hypothetical protein